MSPQDRQHLNTILDNFIQTAINRRSISEEMEYQFNLPVKDLESSLQQFNAEEVMAFFREFNVGIQYDKENGIFHITVNLLRCSLNPVQSNFLQDAIAALR